MTHDRLPLLWLCGASGVGKSSVGWEVFAQLSREGVRTAFVDSDQISLCYPTPEQGTHALRAGGLAAMWPNLRAAGAQCVVLSGFVHTASEIDEYVAALPGAALIVCRLRVAADELTSRFVGRGWRLDLAAEAVAEAEALDSSDVTDLWVDTDGLDVAATARVVRVRTGGWPGAPAAPVPRRREAAVPKSDGLESLPVLWFSGVRAVGKSTIGYAVFTEVQRSGLRAAYLDVKQIAALRPLTADDPEGQWLKAANLGSLWAGFREAGAGCLIVSGEADDADTMARYVEQLPATTVTVCRLVANAAALAERVAVRGRGGGPAIPGDDLRGLTPEALQRLAEQATRDADLWESAGGVRVVTDGQSVEDVVHEVRLLMGGLPGD